jgi:phosphate transport system substrate-binding protein
MPRNGKLVRITLALAAAALLGALAVTTAGAAGAKRSSGTIVGAGSSLIAPAIQGVWSQKYKGATVQYSSVGSGAGIASITARDVDFGASDAPLTPDQATACNGCVQIPWALAATGPVYNIPGVGDRQLKLTGSVLANIYLGKITTWNAPALKKLNKGVNLPSTSITVVHRSDGSGDTYAFTNYLSKVSKVWKNQVGFATTVSWPAGVGGKGNSGVAAVVRSTPGSIGYVSTAYTIQNHLAKARMKNASGKYTIPRIPSIEAAAQLVKAKRIPKNNAISIVDPPKSKKYANAWPISTFTYVIVPKTTAKAAELRAFITWALKPKAQKAIQRLVFAPMPKVVVNAAAKTLKKLHS